MAAAAISESVVLLVILASCLFQLARCDCDPATGPAGSNDCNIISWQSCVSTDYMRIQTGGLASCDGSFCWYNCLAEMTALLGADAASSITDCVCPNAYPSVELPAICYDPPGTDCSWYSTCLEASVACAGTSDDYAIGYGTKFCNLYTANYDKFTAIGKQWVAAVRKCLQVKLVALVRPFRSKQTCEHIREVAFDSHTPCYLKPDTTAPSVCDMSCRDSVQILLTIYPALAMWKTYTAGARVIFNCLFQDQCLKNFYQCIRAVVVDTNLPTTVASAGTASTAVAAIAKAKNWALRGISYLGLAARANAATLAVAILIGAPDVYNCMVQIESGASGRKRAVSSVDLDEVVRDLESSVQSGSLLFDVDGTPVYVTAMGMCDPSCDEASLTDITAPPLADTTAAIVPASENTTPGSNPDGSGQTNSNPGKKRRRRKGYAQKGRGRLGKGRHGLGGYGSTGKGKGKGKGNIGKGQAGKTSGSPGNGNGSARKGQKGKGKGNAGKGTSANGKGKGQSGKGNAENGKGPAGKGKGHSGQG